MDGFRCPECQHHFCSKYNLHRHVSKQHRKEDNIRIDLGALRELGALIDLGAPRELGASGSPRAPRAQGVPGAPGEFGEPKQLDDTKQDPDEFNFVHPFTATFSGPTASGKEKCTIRCIYP